MQMKNLNDFPTLEDGTRRTFISSENGRKHIGDNPNGLSCRRYKVDGNILTDADGKKCDFLLVNDDGKDAYFIELKGSEIDIAPSQIEATIEALKNSLKGYYFFKRIICSKAGTHKMQSSTIVQWKRKNNDKHHEQPMVVIKEVQYTDLMVRS